jgi:hypothetical protein
MTALISDIAPIPAGQTFVSSVQFVQRATQIAGTVFADQAGTIFIEQSGDGVHFDISASYAIAASTGEGFVEDVLAQYWRIRFTNTSGTGQTVFRLYANALDPYGDFLAAALAPSAGGAWAVLQLSPQTGQYIYVGRFDGADGWGACGNAAISLRQSAKYAAFPVATATVSDESLTPSTSHGPDSF